MNTTLYRTVKDSRELSVWIISKFNPMGVPADEGEALAAAAIDLIFEHHSAVTRLAEAGHYASAYTLLRPMAEADFSAWWLLFCAEKFDIDNVKNGRRKLELKWIVSALRKHPQLKNAAWLNRWDKTLLHDFTHSGFSQLSRRLRSDQVVGLFSAHERRWVLAMADLLVLEAARLAYELYPDRKSEIPELLEKTNAVDAQIVAYIGDFKKASQRDPGSCVEVP